MATTAFGDGDGYARWKRSRSASAGRLHCKKNFALSSQAKVPVKE
ncbi:MAG: hypothetical protein ACFB0D_03815 [Phormidesmis sp.]